MILVFPGDGVFPGEFTVLFETVHNSLSPVKKHEGIQLKLIFVV